MSTCIVRDPCTQWKRETEEDASGGNEIGGTSARVTRICDVSGGAGVPLDMVGTIPEVCLEWAINLIKIEVAS
jgi:hypothetical protein